MSETIKKINSILDHILHKEMNGEIDDKNEHFELYAMLTNLREKLREEEAYESKRL